ncbi:MAG TPA: serine--tRNA ligase [Patescibacteria group bacterium]|nr:serine--tRNA ligase [Patescibacteria group bacterium]
MLDINFIKENPEKVKEGLKRRLFKDIDLVDDVISLYEEKKILQVDVEKLRGQKNKAADAKNIEEGKKIKLELTSKESKLTELENKLEDVLSGIPNLPDEDIPQGPEENKKYIKKVGDPKKFDFKPKDHLDLGTSLGIMDVERAAKISGSRFAYLKGDGVLLEFALVNFALEKLIKESFTPILPPMLIKKEITDGLGYWSGGGNENYYYVLDYDKDEGGKELENPLYLVGTGEHSIVPMHKGEILEEKELPKKYVAFSSCFRREAGSYGKETRGIFRVHQFDKVEMVVFSKPEESEKVLKQMLIISEDLMQELGLPYQVVELAAGDIGFPSVKTYDIETWMPGQGNYRETHSISTTTDYQARRLNIKYKGNQGNIFIHILNGTALAIGRTIIAILENYQNSDGSITIPEVLRKWMGKDLIKK